MMHYGSEHTGKQLLKDLKQGGCFVCTHQEFMTLPDSVLERSIIHIDELHELLHEQRLYQKLEKCTKVVAFSATLGG